MTTIRTDILGTKISLGRAGSTPDEERDFGRVRALTFDPTSQGFVMLVQLDDGALVEAGMPGIGDQHEVGAVKVVPEETKPQVTPRELELEVALLQLGEAASKLTGPIAPTDDAALQIQTVLGALARAEVLLKTKAW